MAIVYYHISNKDNSVFYIGIGKKDNRAFSDKNRNRYWHNYTKKYGFRVEIVLSNISYEQAKNWERYLISLYGRRNLKTGNLLNLTDGGDGSLNYIPTKETKEKFRLLFSGCKNYCYNKYGENHPAFGFKHSDDFKQKLSKIKKGKKRPEISGKLHPRRKRVTNGVMIFETCKECAKYYNVSFQFICDILKGRTPNKFNISYI